MPNEFPPLSNDGWLDIEVTRFWESDDCCWTQNLRDIIEYICILAEASNNDHASALKLLQERYTAAGLTPPKDYRLYVVDIDGNRIDYNSDFLYPDNWFNYDEKKYYPVFWVYPDNEHPEIDKYLKYHCKQDNDNRCKLTLEEFLLFRESFPDYIMSECNYEPIGKQPVIDHNVGIAANCLTEDSLAESLDSLCDPDTYKYCPIEDAFTNISTLGFYHS